MDIHTAVRKGDLSEVEKCLDRGVDVNVTDIDGETALHRASRYNHVSVVRVLIQRGGGTEVNGGEYDWTALMLAAQYNHPSVIRELLSGGAEINAQDRGGRTALCNAAWWGHTESVESLLETHTDPDISDEDGDTPLHGAVKYNRVEVVKTLLKHGAKLTKNKKGKTPLDVARDKQHDALVTLLKDYQKNPQKYKPATSKPTVEVRPQTADRPRSGVREYVAAMREEVRERRETLSENRNQSDRDAVMQKLREIERRLEEMIARLDRMEQTQTDSAQVLTKSQEQLWSDISDIKEKVEKLPGSTAHTRDLGSRHLYYLAQKLGKKWKDLGASLDIDIAECETIAADCPGDGVYGAYTLVCLWRDRHEGSVGEKKAELKRALKDIGKMDLFAAI